MAICLLVLAITGCSKTPYSESDEIVFPKVYATYYDMVDNGNYIYNSFAGCVFCYNKKTGEYRYACSSPTCVHGSPECPLYDILNVAFLEENCLYYTSMDTDAIGDVCYYAFYNLLDGTETVFRKYSKYEIESVLPKTDGTYVYYTCRMLKDGSDPENPENYVPFVCRQPLGGGKEEVLCEIGETWALHFTTEKNLIFCADQDTFIMTAHDGSDEQILFQNDEYSVIEKTLMYEGKLYFLVRDGSSITDINGNTTRRNVLLCVDIATKNVEQITKSYVVKFTISNGKIYYLPFEYRVLYSADDLKQNTSRTAIQSADWHCCNLDGTEDNIVYSDDSVFVSHMDIYNDVVYAQVKFYDYKENKYSMITFVTIDLETGELTPVVRMDAFMDIIIPN